MRKLPIYVLLDCSGSMHGDPIDAVNNGLQMLVSTLRQDPYALETAYMSVITFSDTAQQVVPLTDITSFTEPVLSSSGTTAMGAALQLAADCIEREVQKGSAERKGDWKPVVFLMTDGVPTDSITAGLNAFRAQKLGMVVACAAGMQANTDMLKQITENVVQLDSLDSASIKAFFKWVSASIMAGSQKVGDNQGEISHLKDLPAPPPEVNVVL